MFLVFFIPDVLVELLKQDLRIIHYWELVVPLFLMVMFCWTTSNPAQCRIIQKFCGWTSSGTVFLVFCCHFFSNPSTTKTATTNHNSPIMTKTTSNLTTSHETPVKSTPGKLVMKNQHSRIGDEQIQTRLGGKPSNQSSPVSVSTAMPAL